MSPEVIVNIEAVRIPPFRDNYGDLAPLGESIQTDGLRKPITLWRDGTLISGGRRLRTYFLLSGVPGGARYRHIPAVFIDTIEEAAKRLLIDSEDDELALPMASIEKCRLWETLRTLDEPAATRRADAARRRGIELRKKTLSGQRKPARSGYSTDYVLDLIAPAFGMSATSAGRLWSLYMLASAPTQPEDRREAARQAMRDIDTRTKSLYGAYIGLLGGNKTKTSKPKAEAPAVSAPGAKQLATWDRSLPHLEGLVAGLIELGPANPDLTWDQVGPVHARLSNLRRDLEKIIKQMKETAK